MTKERVVIELGHGRVFVTEENKDGEITYLVYRKVDGGWHKVYSTTDKADAKSEAKEEYRSIYYL